MILPACTSRVTKAMASPAHCRVSFTPTAPGTRVFGPTVLGVRWWVLSVTVELAGCYGYVNGMPMARRWLAQLGEGRMGGVDMHI